MNVSRRQFLATSAAALAAPALAAAQTRRPNIIFILADDLGYGDLGCYGQQVIHTPRIDQMAGEGLRFTDAYAGSTVCAPSRCCLMTGLHTGHAWIRGNARLPLREEDHTVAELLKEAGYSTGLVGKWGLGNENTTGVPNKQGFDYFFGYLDQGHAHNYYPEFLWKNEEKFPLDGNVEEAPQVSSQRTQYTHDLFTQEALSFIERQEKDQPFFLYLAYTIPHANNERGGAKGNGMEVPDYGEYAERDWAEPEKGRAAMISRLDRDVGRLLDLLKEQGLDEDTLVFFSSDNGPHKEGGADSEFFDSNGPLRGIKRDLYEGGIRVPLIARWPRRSAAGLSDHVCAFWDFFPTFAAVAGAPLEMKGLDGISILPTLLGEPRSQAQHPYLYWEFYEGAFKQAARWQQWKAVRIKGAATELYDLRQDLAEAHNLAGDHADIVARLEGFMSEAHVESVNWPVPA